MNDAVRCARPMNDPSSLHAGDGIVQRSPFVVATAQPKAYP
jgi:hypothetical protein